VNAVVPPLDSLAVERRQHPPRPVAAASDAVRLPALVRRAVEARSLDEASGGMRATRSRHQNTVISGDKHGREAVSQQQRRLGKLRVPKILGQFRKTCCSLVVRIAGEVVAGRVSRAHGGAIDAQETSYWQLLNRVNPWRSIDRPQM
jgi:hypothetical protein